MASLGKPSIITMFVHLVETMKWIFVSLSRYMWKWYINNGNYENDKILISLILKILGRRHPVYSFQKYKMHVKIFITSIKWFILWYRCLVDSCKTHSVEKMWCLCNFLNISKKQSLAFRVFQYVKCSFLSPSTLKSYFPQNVRIFFSWFKRSFLLTFL